MQHLLAFLNEEHGAITIEWVALAAGVVLLALGVIGVLVDPITGVAVGIKSGLGVVVSDTLAGATLTSG
ncbi:hypothetical protein H0I76_16420 [Limibaculum sp. M0105]|uniref:Uncharacterized protein n=1 Tax=Thermohalobaculum xanthum TaxID=2753746 RepID=A0A8J7SGC5_9RHOB|nr:hypothetical protein [Thermohalobaculum xanthum]MBK0400786.1 hypothetical protein [Thermohalobaculum xanthum]